MLIITKEAEKHVERLRRTISNLHMSAAMTHEAFILDAIDDAIDLLQAELDQHTRLIQSEMGRGVSWTQPA